MKKMIVTSPGKVDADAVDIIMNDSVTKAMCSLLGVMKAFERLARLMSAMNVEGTLNGVDIYEAFQGVHDFTASALSYLVAPNEKDEVESVNLPDDEQFEKLVSILEEGGHA